MSFDVNWLSLMLHVGCGATVALLFTRYTTMGFYWMLAILVAAPYGLLLVVNLLMGNDQGWIGAALYLASFMVVLRSYG